MVQEFRHRVKNYRCKEMDKQLAKYFSEWQQAMADRDGALKMALESDGKRRDFWLERVQTRIEDADHAASKIMDYLR